MSFSGGTSSVVVRVGLAATVACAAWVAPSAQQTVTFKAGVDLVAVETQVIDKEGQPIGNLGKDQFQVWINGQPREVVSADLVQYPLAAPRSLLPSPVDTPDTIVRPDVPGITGRIVVLAVDEVSFSMQGMPPVIDAIKRFVAKLPEDDVVALYSYPFGTGGVNLTHYHNQIAVQVGKLQGMRHSDMGGEFAMSPSEAVDIASDDRSTQQAVWSRECLVYCAGSCVEKDSLWGGGCGKNGDTPPGSIPTAGSNSFNSAGYCAGRLKQQAQNYVSYYEQISNESFNGLRTLLQTLSVIPGPKTVLLLSAGLMTSDRVGGRPDVTTLMARAGQLTAAANVTLYAFHMDGSMLDSGSASGKQFQFNQCQAGMSGSVFSQSRERQLNAYGLERIAGESGGQFFQIGAGTGDLQFGRVLTETSAYYLLGVKPETADRDGRLHFIRVKTADVKGATVRARTQVIIPKATGGS